MLESRLVGYLISFVSGFITALILRANKKS